MTKEVPLENFLEHYGIKGMKWGVRRTDAQIAAASKKLSYKERAFNESAGAKKVSVTAKNGDVLSIEKRPLGPLASTVGRAFNRNDPSAAVSTMVIRNADRNKVGEFQIWREKGGVVRGEWLTVSKSEQGKGYSEAAIRGLIKASENDPQVKEARLQVPSDAAAAKHIYSKIGFKKDFDYGDAPGYGNIEDWVYTPNKKD